MKRKEFIVNTIKTGIGMGIIGGLYSWQIEPFSVEYCSLDMTIKNLPKHLENKSLIQFSDLHIGKRFNPNYIINSFSKTKMKYQPDYVVYTGDFVSSHKRKIMYDELEKVMKHSIKGTIGTFAILGNHDYGNNWQEADVAQKIIDILEKNDIKVLRNEMVNSDGLNIIGIDDVWGTNFYPEKVLTENNILNSHVCLLHNPDVCDYNIWGSYNNWILCGHTHGGQVKPPFLPAPMLPVKNKKYSSGKIDLSNDRTLYINRALGCLWQVRFNVRPEITIFTLKNKIA